MIKKSLFCSTLAIGFASLTYAYDELYYVTAGIGYGIPDTATILTSGGSQAYDVDTNAIFSIDFGYKFDNDWIGELEFDYGTYDVTSGGFDQGEISSMNLMFNGIRQFNFYKSYQKTGFGIDLGIGLGLNFLNIEDVTGVARADTTSALAAQGILGGHYRINKSFVTNLEFRYVWTDTHEFDEGNIREVDMDPTAIIELGFSYEF